jgi:hypothetical protein
VISVLLQPRAAAPTGALNFRVDRFTQGGNLGLTTSAVNPMTGKRETVSTLYENNIADFATFMEANKTEAVDYTAAHEGEHQVQINKGRLPQNYINPIADIFSENQHEVLAERAAMRSAKNPNLPLLIANNWIRDPAVDKKPYAWLDALYKSALRHTFGAANVEGFIREYNTYIPNAQNFFGLVEKYGRLSGVQNAKTVLEKNYRDELEYAGAIADKIFV